ncbi:class I SAM-dependent methyltransferase [Chryseomicrobium sp. FSL W7-1435]|uniref:class I SAM-dependent methyltransferase n=1 Tax=Chryseomicrobium sp. FSL W7-1435 TaxID=2921704 RepID=UPI00315A5B9B
MQTYIPHHFYQLLVHQMPTRLTPSVILDVGCGEGWMTRELSRHHPEAKVVGIDRNYKAIQKCRYLAATENLPVDYQVANIDSHRFATDERFDLITCHNVLAHCQNPKQVLRKLIDQLQLEGQLSLVIENPAAKSIEHSFRQQGIDWTRIAKDPAKLLDWFRPFQELVDQTITKRTDQRVLLPLLAIESFLNEWEDITYRARGLSVFMDYCENDEVLDSEQLKLEEELSGTAEYVKYSYFYHVVVQKTILEVPVHRTN